MNGYLHHLAFDFSSGIRDATLMLMNYLFPIGFFVMIGLFMPAINPDFVEIMIPGMLVFAVMTGTLMTIPATLIDQRSAGILRSFRVNGVPAGALITIPLLSALFHTAVVSTVLTVIGAFFYGALTPTNWLWFIITLLLTTLTLATLSVLIGLVVPSSRTATLIAQLVYVPSVLLGGLMVPEGLLPEALARGASLLPATQAMRAFNALALGGEALSPSTGLPLLVLAASILVNLALCFAVFQWDTREMRPRRFLAALAIVPFVIALVLW